MQVLKIVYLPLLALWRTLTKGRTQENKHTYDICNHLELNRLVKFALFSMKTSENSRHYTTCLKQQQNPDFWSITNIFLQTTYFNMQSISTNSNYSLVFTLLCLNPTYTAYLVFCFGNVPPLTSATVASHTWACLGQEVVEDMTQFV